MRRQKDSERARCKRENKCKGLEVPCWMCSMGSRKTSQSKSKGGEQRAEILQLLRTSDKFS